MREVGETVKTLSGRTGVVKSVSVCPALLRPEYLIEFEDGGEEKLAGKFLEDENHES